MSVKTTTALKADFLGTDPNQQNTDLVDTLGRASSATVAGLVELATDAEAKTGTDTARAVTPANLAAVLGTIKLITIDGRNGAGACTATGAVIGDKVVAVAGITSGALGDADAAFEDVVTVTDQIQQSSASNLSANDYIALLISVA